MCHYQAWANWGRNHKRTYLFSETHLLLIFYMLVIFHNLSEFSRAEMIPQITSRLSLTFLQRQMENFKFLLDLGFQIGKLLRKQGEPMDLFQAERSY